MELLIVTVEGSTSPGALCRVLRETPTRFYVEIVDSGWSLPDMHHAVTGYGRALYVAKRDVLAVGITCEQYATYKTHHSVWLAADRELQERRERLAQAYEADAGLALGITQPWRATLITAKEG